MESLEDQTAVVTGGTSGIGLAAAKRFAAEGAFVFITGRRQEALDDAVGRIGPHATGIRGDVADPADLDRLYASVTERGKPVDVLFANAGGGEFASLEQITAEHFDATFDVNVKGLLFTVQKALPLLNPEGASVILTGSTAAGSGAEAFGVYAASKAAVRSFGRTWANELKGRNVRVNTLVPGVTDTAGITGLAPNAEEAEKLKALLTSQVPLGRMSHPDEIAAAALFLASKESSYVTGSELYADGGLNQI